ncbi:MAG TPA: hypothetical protein VFI34_11870, partial [Candidatus Limnocylindrales bacterium]|nr:hypothetical protein [Candidatus Limnocylindrales bacterium]
MTPEDAADEAAAMEEWIEDHVTDSAWDSFVNRGEPGSYMQLSGWARVKAVNGWRKQRWFVDGDAESGAATIGAQVLVRRPRPLPWSFAYAPRGPVS